MLDDEYTAVVRLIPTFRGEGQWSAFTASLLAQEGAGNTFMQARGWLITWVEAAQTDWPLRHGEIDFE